MDIFDIGSLGDALGLGSSTDGAQATSPLGTSITEVAGPFFLGFSFQFFGMGIVLMLSLHYFSMVSSHPKSPSETAISRRVAVALVVASLISNFAQSIVDTRRGWTMFAVNFMNIKGLLTPSASYFLSPFFGLFPAIITQCFLLRRCLVFISSLSSFWPRLAHPTSRWAFGIVMSLFIFFGNAAGTSAAVIIWKSPNLWSLGRADRESSAFQIAELSWLTTSSAVDIILSIVLCVELWWARAHLAAKGGPIGQAVTRLILITFHGGLAVTTIQLTALFLYQFAKTSSWCYFPVLSLPKFYTITLILSLSLPHTHGTGPSPSHVFSLPTITSHHHPTSPLPPSPPASHRSLSLIPVSPLCNGEEKGAKRKSLKSVKSGHRPTLCDSVEKGWRKSQEWIGWSFVGRPTPREAGRRSLPSHKKSGSKEFDHTPGRAWSRQEDLMDPEMAISSREGRNGEKRRPSEPSSLAPLLSPNSQRRPSSTMLLQGSLWGEALSDISPTRQFTTIDHPLTPTFLQSSMAMLATPPPIITVDRAHSFSDRRRSLPSHTYTRRYTGAYEQPGPSNYASASSTSLVQRHSARDFRATAQDDQPDFATDLFTSTDPFNTTSTTNPAGRDSMPVVLAQGGGGSLFRRPSLSPFGMTKLDVPDQIPLRSISAPDVGQAGDFEAEDWEEHGKRARRGGGRLMSFEDMLNNGPEVIKKQ